MEFISLTNAALSAAFASHDKTIVTGDSDTTVRIWSTANAELMQWLRQPWGWINAVDTSRTSDLFVVAPSTSVAYVYQMGIGTPRCELKGHTDEVLAAGLSPDGTVAVTGGRDNTVRTWNPQSGLQQRVLSGHESIVTGVRVASSGIIVSGSYDGTVRLWQSQTGLELCRLVSFDSGDWAVVTREGRFDASNMDNIRGLHWVCR